MLLSYNLEWFIFGWMNARPSVLTQVRLQKKGCADDNVIFFYPGQGDILTVGAAALFSRFQSPARPAVICFLRVDYINKTFDFCNSLNYNIIIYI